VYPCTGGWPRWTLFSETLRRVWQSLCADIHLWLIMFWKGKILYYYEFICRKNKKIRLSENSTLISGEVFLSFSCVRDKLTNCSGPYSWNRTKRLVIIFYNYNNNSSTRRTRCCSVPIERGEHEFPWKYKRKRIPSSTPDIHFDSFPLLKNQREKKEEEDEGYRDMSRAQPAALYYILFCF
jgi:hypothetical protein